MNRRPSPSVHRLINCIVFKIAKTLIWNSKHGKHKTAFWNRKVTGTYDETGQASYSYFEQYLRTLKFLVQSRFYTLSSVETIGETAVLRSNILSLICRQLYIICRQTNHHNTGQACRFINGSLGENLVLISSFSPIVCLMYIKTFLLNGNTRKDPYFIQRSIIPWLLLIRYGNLTNSK